MSHILSLIIYFLTIKILQANLVNQHQTGRGVLTGLLAEFSLTMNKLIWGELHLFNTDSFPSINMRYYMSEIVSKNYVLENI